MSDARVHSLRVRTAVGSYPVYCGEGLLEQAHKYLNKWQDKVAAVVTDSEVSELYSNLLMAQLARAGVRPYLFVIPAGEGSKSQKELFQLYHDFYASELTRGDVVIALGGGVVGDLAGYAAASYLRGVDFVQVPTTLLAQVDSSVGGKVAINLEEGKNLVGAFYQPKMVLADRNVLKSLPPRQFASGMGELIKHGCIRDRELFYSLAEREDGSDLSKVIIQSCAIKAKVVGQDERDRGERMILNFGHTLGHALEKVLGYGALLHGEAVAIGMVMAARWSETLGVAPKGCSGEIARLLRRYHLPTEVPEADWDKVKEAMRGDKKSDRDAINLVLLREIGDAYLQRMTKGELLELTERCL